jgi:hypothetical protein
MFILTKFHFPTVRALAPQTVVPEPIWLLLGLLGAAGLDSWRHRRAVKRLCKYPGADGLAV